MRRWLYRSIEADIVRIVQRVMDDPWRHPDTNPFPRFRLFRWLP